MKPFTFRQWIACAVMIALLFNMAIPRVICRCDGCHCENSLSRLMPDFAVVTNKKCCCTPQEPLSAESLLGNGCCGLPKLPCPCLCCDIQKNNTPVPLTVLLVKKPAINPLWNIVSVIPIDVAHVSVPSHLNHCRTLLPAHVPLHILLCVFLN